MSFVIVGDDFATLEIERHDFGAQPDIDPVAAVRLGCPRDELRRVVHVTSHVVGETAEGV